MNPTQPRCQISSPRASVSEALPNKMRAKAAATADRLATVSALDQIGCFILLTRPQQAPGFARARLDALIDNLDRVLDQQIGYDAECDRSLHEWMR